MREATGELNMTVVTVVAIAAVSLLFYTFVWPSIQSAIRNTSCKAITDAHGVSYHAENSGEVGPDDKPIWICCPEGEGSDSANCTSTSVD